MSAPSVPPAAAVAPVPGNAPPAAEPAPPANGPPPPPPPQPHVCRAHPLAQKLQAAHQALMHHPPADHKAALVGLLREAAKLEHTLMLSYLVAACSIKCTPEEFKTVTAKGSSTPIINRRRALHFEKARAWKKTLLAVSREEMQHLHLVQCLLRALGEQPHFDLPPRSKSQPGTFTFGHWKVKFQSETLQEAVTHTNAALRAVQVPLAPFSHESLLRFVGYESNNAIQHLLDDPDYKEEDSSDAKKRCPSSGVHSFQELVDKVRQAEFTLQREQALLAVPEGETLDDLRKRYNALDAMPPVDLPAAHIRATPEHAMAATRPRIPPLPDFSSIGEMYNHIIKPAYHRAFEEGQVVHHNRQLNHEIVGEVVAEGVLENHMVPTGPVYRSHNFDLSAKRVVARPLDNYQALDAIIAYIVEQGEGCGTLKETWAQLFEEVQRENGRRYAHITLPGDIRNYLNETTAQNYVPPSHERPYFDVLQIVRGSHLYQFMHVLGELQHEENLHDKADLAKFNASRQDDGIPVPPPKGLGDHPLYVIERQLADQFNRVYLVLLVWLSRIYEVHEFRILRHERQAIEMLGTWPLMSMGIRPFLELSSCYADSPANGRTASLFRGLVAQPNDQCQVKLMELFRDFQSRNVARCQQMDELCTELLLTVGNWAAQSLADLSQAAPPNPPLRSADILIPVIKARLQMLSVLREFKPQFAFRVGEGYSDRPQSNPNGFPGSPLPETKEDGMYEEDPKAVHFDASCEDTKLALRLRFAGRGLVLLATDPDPNRDEVGVTGTLMVHAADGKAVFDRALITQPAIAQAYNWPNCIVRKPYDPDAMGVNLLGADLMVVSDKAQAVLVSEGNLSSKGAVQASGIQFRPDIQGFEQFCSIPIPDQKKEGVIRLNLDIVGNQPPYLVGENHLVWKDGEPLDPLRLQVVLDKKQPGQQLTREQRFVTLMQRDVFGGSLEPTETPTSIINMTPSQRVYSARGPTGFAQSTPNCPEWSHAALTNEEREIVNTHMPIRFQKAAKFVASKRRWTLEQLSQPFEYSQEGVDSWISMWQRCRDLTVARGTVLKWPAFFLNYCHTISGPQLPANPSIPNPIFDQLYRRCGLSLAPSSLDRRAKVGGRWLMNYAKGIMDTDALSDVTWVELYIPLAFDPSRVGGPSPSPSAAVPAFAWSRSWTLPPFTSKAPAQDLLLNFDKPFWFNAPEQKNNEPRRRPVVINKHLQLQLHEKYVSGRPADGRCNWKCSVDGVNAELDIGLTVVPAGTDSAPDKLSLKYSVICSPRQLLDVDSAFRLMALQLSEADAMKTALDKYFAVVETDI